jgi:multicomponent Na+:H+ antiporter subunit C
MFFSLFHIVNRENILHKLIGLSIFQTTIIILYLTIGFNHGSDYPIINFEETSEKLSKTVYNNPLPQVLMLTAIVVGVATFAVGLAIMIKINELERDKENTDNYIKEDVIKS